MTRSKCEDLSTDPQKSCKKLGTEIHAYDPSEGDMGDRGGSLVSDTLSQSKGRWFPRNNTQSGPLTPHVPSQRITTQKHVTKDCKIEAQTTHSVCPTPSVPKISMEPGFYAEKGR